MFRQLKLLVTAALLTLILTGCAGWNDYPTCYPNCGVVYYPTQSTFPTQYERQVLQNQQTIIQNQGYYQLRQNNAQYQQQEYVQPEPACVPSKWLKC